MGITWGGQAAFYSVLSYPQVFGKVAAQSVRLMPPHDDVVQAWIGARDRQEHIFHIDWARFDYRKSDLITVDTRRDSRKLFELLVG